MSPDSAAHLNPLAATVPIADLVATREAWHRVAEHVVAKARYLDDGEIRLTAWPGGFATPPLSDGRRVGVSGTSILLEGSGGGGRRSAPLTTLAEAAAFVGIEPGFPQQLYPAATPCQPDMPLAVDRAAAELLGQWYGFGAQVLGGWQAELVSRAAPSQLILWPEHFDQAFSTGDAEEHRRANYGASPGDDGHPEPYLYVGPWGRFEPDPFWSARDFPGALLPLAALAALDDPDAAAREFLRRGRALLVASGAEMAAATP